MARISDDRDLVDSPTIDLTDFTASPGEYLKRVRAGEELALVDGDVVVARLTPVPPDTYVSEDARLSDLERRGTIRRGTGKIPDEYWKLKLPRDPQGLACKALLEEREQGW